MNTILGELGKNPKFCEYIKTIESKKSPIAISGLTDVGMTQMISATREFAKRPILKFSVFLYNAFLLIIFWRTASIVVITTPVLISCILFNVSILSYGKSLLSAT